MLKKLLYSYKNLHDNIFASTAQRLKIEHNLFLNLFLILAPFFFILVNGYAFGRYDHETYIPEILHAYDSGHYPRDYIFDNPTRHYSYFIPFIVMLLKIFPFHLQALCFVGYLICLFFIFWALYHIALNIFRSRATAVLSVLLLFSHTMVAGTKIYTIENYFSIRIPALATGLIFLLFLINNRYYLASMFCGITFLIHPIIALPLISILFLRLFGIGLLHNKRKVLISTFILFSICLPLIINYSSVSGTQTNISESYLAIIQGRAPYIFMTHWRPKYLITFISYALLVIAFIVNKSYIKYNRLIIYDFVIVWVAFTVVGIVFSDVLPNHLIIQLQLLRSTLFIVLLIDIFLSYFLINFLTHSHTEYFNTPTIKNQLHFSAILFFTLTIFLFHLYIKNYLFIVILFLFLIVYTNRSKKNVFLLLMVAAVCAIFSKEIHIDQCLNSLPSYFTVILLFFFLYYVLKRVKPFTGASIILNVIIFFNIVIIASVAIDYRKDPEYFLFKHLNLPGRLMLDPWLDVCLKCKKNTMKDTIFLIPPDERYFRVIAERSPVVNWKDGTFAIFSEKIAYQWYQRMRDLQHFSELKKTDFKALSKKYGAQYIITENKHVIDYPIVYKNQKYTVYNIL